MSGHNPTCDPPESVPPLTSMPGTSPCPGCESLRRQCSELAGELGAARAGNGEYRERLAQLNAELADSEAARRHYFDGMVTAGRQRDEAVAMAKRDQETFLAVNTALERERDEARRQLAIQHEAMTQLRAGHAEALAGADSQVSAALKTVSRWQGENERLTAELATCRERNAAIAAQSDQYRDQRDEAIAGFIDTADRDEYQLVVAEMIAHWERIGTSREEDRLIDGDGEAPGWRARGGLEPLS